jgi:serine phosphatase RsbU (regulator of sigma subunit)/anti-sigma regulatory factor (Ser/Thr protein kinase)
MTPRAARPVLSIRWIVACAAAVLTVVVGLSVTAVMERRTRNVLSREIETRLLLQARNLALAGAGALLTEFPELTLTPLLKEMQARQPELALIAVIDRSGRIEGSPDVRLLGSTFVRPARLGPVPTEAALQPHESIAANGTILLASTPVVHANGEIMGTALVGLSRAYIEVATRRIREQQYVVLGPFLLGGIAASFLLMSILLRPIAALRAGIERIGRGEWETPLRLRDRTEFGLLADAINGMSRDLKKAQDEVIERERLAHEMDLAKQIQRSFLPARQTVAGAFVIAGEQWAAAEVGGDYYDTMALPDGTVAVAVADVSGKGLAGCLVTSMLYSLLRALRSTYPSPSSLLIAMDERLGEVLQRGDFVTMFYGVLDPESGRLVYASAGHNPLLVYRAETRRAEWIYTKGIPLGAVRGGEIRRTLEDAHLDLGPGDVLVQFTDGVNETVDARQVPFGFERMEGILVEAASRGAREILHRLHNAVHEWRGSDSRSDDETVLVISREGAPSPESAGAAELLAEARARGACLVLPATLDCLRRIADWLPRTGALRGLSTEESALLTLALHEAAANIVEHGYGFDAEKTFEMCWVPGRGDARAPAPRNGIERSPVGHFLMLDRGSGFRPSDRKRSDFGDASVRKRGRGFGLDIIYNVMGDVTYHPGTTAGNITVMLWDPGSRPAPQGKVHVA